MRCLEGGVVVLDRVVVEAALWSLNGGSRVVYIANSVLYLIFDALSLK